MFSKHFYSASNPTPPPDAAFVNVPPDSVDRVRGFVEQGYVVEAEADTDTVQPRASAPPPPSFAPLLLALHPKACLAALTRADLPLRETMTRFAVQTTRHGLSSCLPTAATSSSPIFRASRRSFHPPTSRSCPTAPRCAATP